MLVIYCITLYNTVQDRVVKYYTNQFYYHVSLLGDGTSRIKIKNRFCFFSLKRKNRDTRKSFSVIFAYKIRDLK